MRLKGFLDVNNCIFPFSQRKDMLSSALYNASRLAILAKSLHLSPSWIQIEPTTKCNLRCTICLRSHTCPDMNYDMSINVFKQIINQSLCSRFVKPVIKLIGLGEPLLNPNIGAMVMYAKSKGLNVEMTSNFTFLSPKTWAELVNAQLDYLYISVDAASPQAFESIRVGAKFDEVINNIKLFLKIRKNMNSTKPKVLFRATINEDNAKEIPAISELATSIGVDGVIFANQIMSGKENNGNSDITKSSSEELHGKTSIWIKKKKSICPALRRCYITYDGTILPCNFLMEIIPREEYSQFAFGNITQNSISSIWFSKRYKQFRVAKVAGFHPYFCKNCTSIP